MTTPTIIAPSILSADAGCYAEEIRTVAAAGGDWIHIDVMDGHFVPPITFGDNIVKVAKQACSLPLDVHLMVHEPIRHVEAFADAGSSRLTVHVEACANLGATLDAIQARGISAGISVKPKTQIEAVFPFLDRCDLVLIMTVEPGWGGQSFIEEMLPKISAVNKEISRRGLGVKIEVDGGINAETGKRCQAAGANVLVAGSYIFGSKDRGKAVASLR